MTDPEKHPCFMWGKLAGRGEYRIDFSSINIDDKDPKDSRERFDAGYKCGQLIRILRGESDVKSGGYGV